MRALSQALCHGGGTRDSWCLMFLFRLFLFCWWFVSFCTIPTVFRFGVLSSCCWLPSGAKTINWSSFWAGILWRLLISGRTRATAQCLLLYQLVFVKSAGPGRNTLPLRQRGLFLLAMWNVWWCGAVGCSLGSNQIGKWMQMPTFTALCWKKDVGRQHANQLGITKCSWHNLDFLRCIYLLTTPNYSCPLTVLKNFISKYYTWMTVPVLPPNPWFYTILQNMFRFLQESQRVNSTSLGRNPPQGSLIWLVEHLHAMGVSSQVLEERR